MRPPYLLILASFGLSLLGGACGPAFVLERPADFLELDDSRNAPRGYAYRATSADGAVVAVRRLENRGHGSLAFWTEVIRNQLRYGGGYAVLEETSVRAASGESGTRLVCGRDQGGRTYTYWVTLFVVDEQLFVVEAGGEREAFERARPAVEASLAGFRID